MRTLPPIDHARVTDAVRAAEGATAGEIVTVVTDASDRYHDVALHYAIGVTFAALAGLALCPRILTGIVLRVRGGWEAAPGLTDTLLALFVLLALIYLLMRLIFAWAPLRYRLSPRATKHRRVRRRAIELFRVGAEARTGGRTGILLYLSQSERMAEIVADEAIHAIVPQERWGDAMAALIAEVRQGRATDGMVAAVAAIGAILSDALPRAADDINELPDRLIEL